MENQPDTSIDTAVITDGNQLNDGVVGDSNLLSRKFLLTVAFILIVVLNSVFKWGMTNEDFLMIAGLVSVYLGVNVLQKKVN